MLIDRFVTVSERSTDVAQIMTSGAAALGWQVERITSSAVRLTRSPNGVAAKVRAFDSAGGTVVHVMTLEDGDGEGQTFLDAITWLLDGAPLDRDQAMTAEERPVTC